MRRKKLLKKKILKIEEVLNWWAKDNGVIRGGETLVVSVRVSSENDRLKMSPVEFFSTDRLLDVGLTKTCATRAHNGIRNTCDWEFSVQGRPLRKRTKPIRTLEEFLSVHKDVSDLSQVRNLGPECIRGLVKAMNQAGFSIEDSQGRLK